MCSIVFIKKLTFLAFRCYNKKSRGMNIFSFGKFKNIILLNNQTSFSTYRILRQKEQNVKLCKYHSKTSLLLRYKIAEYYELLLNQEKLWSGLDRRTKLSNKLQAKKDKIHPSVLILSLHGNRLIHYQIFIWADI